MSQPRPRPVHILQEIGILGRPVHRPPDAALPPPAVEHLSKEKLPNRLPAAPQPHYRPLEIQTNPGQDPLKVAMGALDLRLLR